MAGLAGHLRARGLNIHGSDLKRNHLSGWLTDQGVTSISDQAKLTAAMSGTKASKEEFLKLCFKESIFRLQTLFFGEDAFGRNVSHQLKQVIATLRPKPSKGIEKYRRRITELQSYVPYTLWEQGMKLRDAEHPEPLSTDKLRDRLGDAAERAAGLRQAIVQGRVVSVDGIRDFT